MEPSPFGALYEPLDNREVLWPRWADGCYGYCILERVDLRPLWHLTLFEPALSMSCVELYAKLRLSPPVMIFLRVNSAELPCRSRLTCCCDRVNKRSLGIPGEVRRYWSIKPELRPLSAGVEKLISRLKRL